MKQEKMCKVTVGNRTLEYPDGTCYGDIVKDFQDMEKEPVVLVMKDNRLRELHKKVHEDCELSLITLGDTIGHKTYKRSMNLLLLRAVYHVAGSENIEKIVLHFSVDDGFYYTIQGKVKVDQEFLDKTEAYMRELVERQLPVMKRTISTAGAIRLFHQYGMYDKEKLFRYRRVSRVNLYSLDGFEDYFYGFMVWHTGYLSYFKLHLYDEGFVLMMPSVKHPDQVKEFCPSPKIFQVQKQSEKWGEMMEISMVGELNEKISRGDIKDMILISEALQEGKISDIAQEIVSRKDVKFVMIAGPSSSGKTTFSHRLSIQLAAHGLRPHPVAVDNYFVDREDNPRDENGNYDFECLEAIDLELFNHDMNALLRGERVEIPRFNFTTGRREYKGDFLQMKPNDILVIEGIHALNDKMSYSLPHESKYKIYISALTQLNVDEHNRIPTTDGRLIRRMVRDNRTRGTNAKETISRWPSVRKGEEKNIFPYQEDADVMFNSALIYELSVLKLYAEALLFQIMPEEPEYQEAKRLLKFLDYFVGVPSEDVPNNSILREFVGGSCFDT